MQRAYTIGSVSIETGISKDILRKWESRYGFPRPVRHANGRRIYPLEQVARLTELKRLIDGGMRPAKALTEAGRDLATDGEANQVEAGSGACRSPFTARAVDLLASCRLDDLRIMLERDLARRGLLSFLEETVAELNWAVGERWSDGSLRVFEEHAYSTLMHEILSRQVRCLASSSGQPGVLLTTPPGELHTLGLAMVKACFTEAGARCLDLGAQTPPEEVAAAVRAYGCQVVGLSISSTFPKRQVLGQLLRYRSLLPAECGLWVGGAGAGHLGRVPDGVRVFASLGPALGTLRALQAGIIDVQ